MATTKSAPRRVNDRGHGTGNGVQVHCKPIPYAVATAILDAMDAALEATPDGGEGSTWHHRSDFAWQIHEDYRTADEPDTIAEFDDGMTPDDIRATCVRSAANAIARWLEEDKASG